MQRNSPDSHPLSAPTPVEAPLPRPAEARRAFRRGTRAPRAAGATEQSGAGAALERQLLLVQTADAVPLRAGALKKTLLLLTVLALLGAVGGAAYGVVQWEQRNQEKLTALTQRLGELELLNTQQEATLLANKEATARRLTANDQKSAALAAALDRSQADLATQGQKLESLGKKADDATAAYQSLRAEQKAALDAATRLWRGAKRVFSLVTPRRPQVDSITTPQ